jgi:hypothetical protein
MARTHTARKKGRRLQTPRKHFVRARQRDRDSAFPGFDRNLPPRRYDWYVDRFTFTVRGQWETSTNTGQTFFEQRFFDPAERWLRAPTGSGHRRSVVTRFVSPLNVGAIKIEATGCTQRRGHIVVHASVNPTRTLSSLLIRFGAHPNFSDHIASLDELAFFRSPSSLDRLPRALDGGDNYVPSSPSLRSLLPPDPFLRFLPIYLGQLRALLARAISSAPGEEYDDGTEQVFGEPGNLIRLNWGSIEAPQIETYFERYHGRAVAAVRTAGASILDGDRRTLLRVYPNDADMERRADCYRVALRVNDRYRLVVYAKTEDRIRFEMRRHGRGRYSGLPAMRRPDDRLLGILLSVERDEAERLVDWLEIFRQFDEPDAPAVGDLVELVGLVIRAADGDEVQARLLIDRLIADGGLSPGYVRHIGRRTINALVRFGVIFPIEFRRQRLSSGQQRRYVLTAQYAWLQQRVLAALSEAPDRQLSE